MHQMIRKTKNPAFKTIRVYRKPGSIRHDGLLVAGHRTIPCKLGKTGITAFKREGDKATPAGTFRILNGYFRKERIGFTRTVLSMQAIKPDDGWCDDPANSRYNAPVKLPFSRSHENMQREDRLYDICLVLDYNIHPRKRNAGSTIFFHQTGITGGPTLGCIAIDPKEWRWLISNISSNTVMQIHI